MRRSNSATFGIAMKFRLLDLDRANFAMAAVCDLSSMKGCPLPPAIAAVVSDSLWTLEESGGADLEVSAAIVAEYRNG